MLTHRRKSVSLSIISTDLPLWYVVQNTATLEQKNDESFHLILTEPQPDIKCASGSPSLIWLELSPYRVTMTKQAGSVCYRHFWERGIYGTSRYWLGGYQGNDQTLHLRNFTRHLTLDCHPLPQRLQVEYELWSAKVPLGRYILRLEIEH